MIDSRFLLRSVAALAVSALVAGCAVTPRATDRVKVLGGQMTVAAPAGYCVDASARKSSAQGDFVLFGSCAAITGDASAAHAPYPAMLSATIGPKAAAPLVRSFPAFDAFFHSAAGRAAIARSGLAKDVDILAVRQSGDMLLLKIRDRSVVPGGAPVSATYWRAIADFEGHIAALSVLPRSGAAMSDTSQIALLGRFEATIRAAGTASGLHN